MKKNKTYGKILTLFIIAILILDQITKIWLYKKGIATILESNNNNGYYIIISIIIVLMIIRYISSDNLFIKLDTKIILSFGVAGAIGNVIDRIWNKNVIVFIKLGDYINLNLAYIYILIAWIGMALILAKNTVNFMKERKLRKMKMSDIKNDDLSSKRKRRRF